MTLSPQDKERMEKAKEKAIKTSFSVHPHDLCAYGVEVGYTAAMHAHDAEIADLREKCDKLAGAVELTDRYMNSDVKGSMQREEFQLFMEATQIAREVRK